MKDKHCGLRGLARRVLQERHPGMKVERATSLLWWIFDRSAKDALVVDRTLAYVVCGREITSRHLRTAIASGVDVVPSGNVVVFAHRGATVSAEAEELARESSVRIEFLYEEGCPVGTELSRRQ
jgi:intracellular sulfur oxidation DsrE/DsrF family protein